METLTGQKDGCQDRTNTHNIIVSNYPRFQAYLPARLLSLAVYFLLQAIKAWEVTDYNNRDLHYSSSGREHQHKTLPPSSLSHLSRASMYLCRSRIMERWLPKTQIPVLVEVCNEECTLNSVYCLYDLMDCTTGWVHYN